MSHVWRNIKNSQAGGHREFADFRAEFEFELAQFIAGEPVGFSVHPTVLEGIGLGTVERVIDIDQVYSNPYPRLEDHGEYLFGCVSIPTELADGISEFTSLFILATKRQLLTVILDPQTSYAGPFGQRLLNRRSDHQNSGNDDIGETLLMVIRDALTSINFALAEIYDDVLHYSNNMAGLSSRKESEQSEVLSLIESYVLKLRVEIEALETVTRETATLITAIADGQLDLQGDHEIFFDRHVILAKSLAIYAQQTVAFRNKIESRVVAVLDKCEHFRDRMIINATNKIGAVASILLVPTLIVGIYGQNFDMPEKNWGLGYAFSWGLIFVTTVVQVVYFKRKRWL